jgi:hypothetical protein
MKKDIFQQNQITNRIISLSIKIDKLLDEEVAKIYRKKSYEQMKSRSSEDFEELHQMVQYETIDRILEKLSEEYKAKMDDIQNEISKCFKNPTNIEAIAK